MKVNAITNRGIPVRIILIAVPMGLMSLTMSVYLIFVAIEFKSQISQPTTSIPAE